MNAPPPYDPNLSKRFQQVRTQTEALCATLEVEDYCIQAMPDTSPPKWHLAHTTWFFELFVLVPFLSKYAMFNSEFASLFNSYYETVGAFFPRPQRGFLSRPTVAEVYRYREYVNNALLELLLNPPESSSMEIFERVRLGIEHEMQHQELLLMDCKFNFFVNPLKPIYQEASVQAAPTNVRKFDWQTFRGGVAEIGYGGNEFCFDNELPRHCVFLQDFSLATRLVNNAEYLSFIADGGYQRPELWLSDGWRAVQTLQWQAPLYWFKEGSEWRQFTLTSIKTLNPFEPVAHLSYYEADAYARWIGKRLPSEMEWEYAAGNQPVAGNFLESGILHPQAAEQSGLCQIYGDLWEWTQSHYSPYPGFKPLSGMLGEYNGKFMCNQFVLRGGSCLTARQHIRASYRNFFRAEDRWQFSGLRLAGNT